MSLENAIVLGLTLADDDAHDGAVAQIRAQLTAGHRVIAVASASPPRRQSGVLKANRLPASADAYEIARAMIEPDLGASVSLVERLGAAGIGAVALAPEESAPLTRGGALDAEPRVIDANALALALDESRVVVLAGGVGRDFDGRLTSLGGDGGALSAVFIAERLALGVRVQVEAGESTLPRKAALFARRCALRPRLVGASGLDLGVFEPADAPGAPAGAPLRISLLGLGPVGRGVLDELLGAPGRYRVVGVALTSADARYAAGLAPELASFDVHEILTRKADVVINLSSDDGAIADAIGQARLRGVNIVRGASALALAERAHASDAEAQSAAPAACSKRRSWRGVAARKVNHSQDA